MEVNCSELHRRELLRQLSGLFVGFTLSSVAGEEPALAAELGDYGPPPEQIDSWIAISADGQATLFSGCCELGTGSSTGLLQVMAEELDLPFDRIKLMLPDTDRTPDQFVSSGSRTISVHSRPIRIAAAEARAALVLLAAQRLGVTPDRLMTRDGAVFLPGERDRKVTYAELVGGQRFELTITGKAKPKNPQDYDVVGQSVPRWDIPEKVFATFTYVQDVRVR